ncbi:MAG TPA: hypothetical protein VFS21_22485, partial [Roseiflexaceae bacterium]|nr:hypothetical protein [Roseiflexaceae bacterium]
MVGSAKRPWWSRFVLCLLAIALLAVQFAVGLAPTPVAAQAQYVRIKNKWQNTYLFQSSNQVRYGTPAASDTASHWLIE